jgi:flagellar basal-body rod protein FlgG
MQSLSIAATGMLAQQRNVEVISNNIANMNTTGFKRQRAAFHDLLYQNIVEVGAASSEEGTVAPSGVQIGTGVSAASVYRINSQGNAIVTDNTYDLAIQGKGLFVVDLPNGVTGYTRDGSLQLSPTGQIVTTNGFTVQPGITIPTDAIEVTINPSGQVYAKLAGQAIPQLQGQIQLAVFQNIAGLQAIGDNLLVESPSSGQPVLGVPGAVGFGTLQQGFLESSNVNVVSEVTTLITAQRAYEMNSKVIQTTDEMMAAINQLK